MSTPEQRDEALRIGNEVRSAASKRKKKLRGQTQQEGLRSVARWIYPTYERDVGAMKVPTLLGAVRGLGEKRIGPILLQAGIENRNGGKRIRELTDRQRRALAIKCQADAERGSLDVG